MSEESLREYIENDRVYQEYKLKKPTSEYIRLHISLCRDIENIIDENHQLKEELNNINNAYCKVITKCKEMKNSRHYMNDIAIGKYADEIMEICKYYVEEPKWQDSLDKVKE